MRKSRSAALELCFPTNFPNGAASAPRHLEVPPPRVLIYFEDVDAVVERAVSGGAKVLQPLQDQFYGDRSCKLEDPFGHAWMFSTHQEDVSPEELKRRADAMFAEAFLSGRLR